MSTQLKTRKATKEESLGSNAPGNALPNENKDLAPVIIKGAIVIGAAIVVCVVINEVVKRQNEKMVMEMKRINLEQMAIQKKRDEELRTALSAQLKKAFDELNQNTTGINQPISEGPEKAAA